MRSRDPVRRWLVPVLFVTASFLAADLTAAKVEQSLGVSLPGLTSPSPAPSRPGPVNGSQLMGLTNPLELQFVLNRPASNAPPPATNTTGNTTGGNTSAVSANGTAPAPVPQGPLPKLTGTLAGGGHALAVLQSGDQTSVCAIGESMNGYTVVEVSQFSALLRDGAGQTHRLTLELAQMASPAPVGPPPGPAGGPPPGPQPPVPPPGPMPQATPPPDGSISRAQIKNMIDNSGPWISHINVKPIKRGEEVVGVQVNYNLADNPLAKLGVSSGDILTNLNGHPLKNGEDLTWAYSELRNATTLNFQLERNGQMIPMNIHLADGL